jgi:hypothetical protein
LRTIPYFIGDGSLIYKIMMKNILTVLLILFAFNASAQIPEITWQQCYGTITNDYAFGIAKTEDGYMFAIEVFSGDGLTNYHGSYDIWLVNTDSIGNILWEKCYGGSSAESPYKLIKKPEDEYFIFGYAGSTDGDVQSGNHGYSDLWVVKINAEGDIIWEKTYGSIGHDNPRDMILTPDGGFVMIARVGIGGGDVTHYYGSGDCWMAKCDSIGNIEWEKTMGNDGLDNCVSLMINSAGNIMMIGAAQWHGGLVECYPDGEWADVWIVELDMQGNILAQYCYGGSHYDLGYMIIELDEGYAFVAGTNSNDGDVSGLHGPPGGPPGGWSDIWVVRLNEQMEIIWQKCIGGYDSELPNYITQTEDGGFVVIGTTRSNDGDVSGNPSWPGTYAAIWVVKLDAQGNIEWQKVYGGWGSERLENPHTILKKSDHNYVIAASTTFSPSHDVQCGTFSANRNAWIFEIALDDTVNVIEQFAGTGEMFVYPNPATSETWLQLPENLPLTAMFIELYSPTGRLLYRAQPTSKFHKIEVAHLPKGLYFVRIWDGEQWLVEKLVVL